MNHQAVFDQVKNHLFTQGRKAYENSGCKYRDSYGRKCAVGCLIPDDVYRTQFEFNGLWNLTKKYPELRGILGIECDRDEDFLSDLQGVHDSTPDIDWVRGIDGRLMRVSQRYGLHYEPVSSAPAAD